MFMLLEAHFCIDSKNSDKGIKNFKWPNVWSALSDSLYVCTVVHRPYFALGV